MTMLNERFPTITAYIDQAVAPLVTSGSAALMRDYPDLPELRAKEVAAAHILIAYMAELQDWKNLASSRTLTSEQIDDFDYARMDQEDLDGGMYRVLERLTGHRSLGIDVDTIQMLGVSALDLGVYEPNWRETRQAKLDEYRSEYETAKSLAAQDKDAAKDAWLAKELYSYVDLTIPRRQKEKRLADLQNDIANHIQGVSVLALYGLEYHKKDKEQHEQNIIERDALIAELAAYDV